MEGWIKIYHSREEYQAIIIKDLLEEYGFHPVIINQKDSEFPMLGETQVFVAPEEQEGAERVIRENATKQD